MFVDCNWGLFVVEGGGRGEKMSRSRRRSSGKTLSYIEVWRCASCSMTRRK